MGQCYLDGAVHYWAILGGDPYWDSFSVALLTNQFNGKGQKGLGLQGQKPLHQCVTAILAELFITEPSWWWSLLGFFLLSLCFLTSMMARVIEGLGIAGPQAPGSMLSWRCCSLLGHLGGGPYWDSFCCSTAY